MNEKRQKFFSAVVFFATVFVLQGCDQFEKLSEYFSPQQPAATSSATQATGTEKAAPGLKEQDLPQNVLAKVGNWTITLDEFRQRLEALKEVIPAEYDVNDAQNKKFILDELIRQELLVQEAERRGLDKDKDVAMALQEFRRTLLVRQLAEQVAAATPQATADEARAYYDENQMAFTEWRLREIVVPDEQEAKGILIELLQGADFEAMAKERSKGKTAAKGGDLGMVTEFDFPQREQAVATLNAGDLSSIFQGPEGFYIVKVEEKKTQDFSAIKDEIVSGLTLLKQQEAIMALISTLEEKTPVVKNETLLKD